MITDFLKFNLYAISPEGKVVPVDIDKAGELNPQYWDIYWTPQEFPYGKRKIEDLISVRYLCADFDEVDGQGDFRDRLKSFFNPSFVIKTKRGFHAYWELEPWVVGRDGTAQELAAKYRTLVEEVLVPIGADPNAKDVSRLLRPHMFRYWKKNQAEDFWTELVYENEASRQFSLKSFEPFRQKPRQTQKNAPLVNFISKNGSTQRGFATGHLNASDDKFWEKANLLPIIDSLRRLSGSPYVNYETYDFKPQAGLMRIIINGKPSNAWVDKKGTIGSTQRAGPAIPNWLTYFGHDWKRVAEILKEVFHEELTMQKMSEQHI